MLMIKIDMNTNKMKNILKDILLRNLLHTFVLVIVYTCLFAESWPWILRGVQYGVFFFLNRTQK